MPELLLQQQRETLQNKTIVIVIELIGTVTKVNSEQMRKVFLQHTNNKTYHFILDLAQLDEINDTGLGLLVKWLDVCQRHGGDVKIVNCNEKITIFMQDMGIFSLLQPTTKEDALKQLEQSQVPTQNTQLSSYALFISNSQQKLVALQKIEIQVNIDDITSHTTIKQHYINDEQFPIEAIYRFPCSSTIYAFEIETQNKIFRGKVEENAMAFSLYDDAISEGDAAYMLEQDAEDIAAIFVGNILPGQQVLVTIHAITELAYVDDKIEMQIPTTLCPRYSCRDKTLTSLQQSVDSVYATSVAYNVQIEVIVGKDTIADISSPSHKIKVVNERQNFVVQLQEQTPLDRDFVLHLTPSQSHEPVCLVAKHPNGIRAVVARMYPQWDIFDDPQPQEMIFIIDCSDSMQGSSITTAKEVLSNCIKLLGDGDIFNIISFGSIFSPFQPKSVVFNETNMRQAIEYTTSLKANMGNKELIKVLQYVCAKNSGCVRNVILISDGHIDDTTEAIRVMHSSDIRVFVFGIGYSANQDFVKRLPQKTRGSGEIISTQEGVLQKVERQLARICGPMLHSATLEVKGVEVELQQIAPIFEGDSLTIYGRIYKGRVGKTAILSAKIGEETLQWTANVLNRKENKIIPTLWAAKYCEYLQLENREDEIREIGLQFHILTSATSFIAVETLKHKNVQQPQLREIPIQLTRDFRGIVTTREIPAPNEDSLQQFFTPPEPQPSPNDFSGGMTLSMGIPSGPQAQPQQTLPVTFPYIANCTVCGRSLEFPTIGNYKCITCSSYMNVDSYGQKTVYARVNSYVLDVKFPNHLIYKTALIASVTALAQQLNYPPKFRAEITEIVEHVIVIINDKQLHPNESFHMMAVADNDEMIIGFKSVNPFLTKGSRHPRLKSIARIADRLEVFPLPDRRQLLKITKCRNGK